MTGGEDVKKLLECPICKQILTSPIQQCQKGHTICNSCKSKQQQPKCVSCRAPIGTSRNFPLETILNTVAFQCHHHHKGCSEILKIQDLEEHQKICEYRPLKCHLGDMDNCNGTLLYLTDIQSHLQNTHKLKTVKPEEGQSNVFTSNDNIYWDDEAEDGADNSAALQQGYWKGRKWDGELHHFDGSVFVSLIRFEKPLTYFGFYLIGQNADSLKYRVTISMTSSSAPSVSPHGVPPLDAFKIGATVGFTSIREFQLQELELEENRKLPRELIVHDDILVRAKTIRFV